MYHPVSIGARAALYNALAESHAELVAALADTADRLHYLTRVGHAAHEQSWEDCIYYPCASNRDALANARALVPTGH